MKIIFSRKGFDGDNGGMPSAYVENGEMVSFPIPASGRADLIRYAEIRAEGISMQERIEQLCQGEGKIFSPQRCHHDPDLVGDSRIRPSSEGWAGAFGQSGRPNDHLKNTDIAVGDLFLFFGWFKRAEQTDRGLHFVKKAPDQHALFGYLQIGKMWEAGDMQGIPSCFNDHPHVLQKHLSPDAEEQEAGTLYVAQKYLEIPGVAAERLMIPDRGQCPGFGVFRYAPNLVLTAENEKRRSYWRLCDFFQGQIRKDYLTREGPNLFRARRGQEFVVNTTPQIREWVAERICAGMGVD